MSVYRSSGITSASENNKYKYLSVSDWEEWELGISTRCPLSSRAREARIEWAHDPECLHAVFVSDGELVDVANRGVAASRKAAVFLERLEDLPALFLFRQRRVLKSVRLALDPHTPQALQAVQGGKQLGGLRLGKRTFD